MTCALLVDAGGVLFSNVTEESDFLARLADRHGADPAALRRELDRRDAEYETGARHVHDVLADCLAAAGGDPEVPWDAERVDLLYTSSVRPYPAALRYLADLRTTRPDLVLALANNEAEHWDLLKDARYGHRGLFDVIGSSWRLGAVKPTPEYFDRLLRACRCTPGGAVLADDNPAVLAAAAEAGVGTVLVRDEHGLAEAVRVLDQRR